MKSPKMDVSPINTNIYRKDMVIIYAAPEWRGPYLSAADCLPILLGHANSTSIFSRSGGVAQSLPTNCGLEKYQKSMLVVWCNYDKIEPLNSHHERILSPPPWMAADMPLSHPSKDGPARDARRETPTRNMLNHAGRRTK